MSSPDMEDLECWHHFAIGIHTCMRLRWRQVNFVVAVEESNLSSRNKSLYEVEDRRSSKVEEQPGKNSVAEDIFKFARTSPVPRQKRSIVVSPILIPENQRQPFPRDVGKLIKVLLMLFVASLPKVSVTDGL
ncbi:Cadherin-13 [Pteropus alecto]|uniref:Cadherin-13 n=1 Tax=Pteropus alecto TaxID=9402 RepID=L5JQQ9_PTEAL|nr:Cadherin-13 [Pteropus alecto]